MTAVMKTSPEVPQGLLTLREIAAWTKFHPKTISRLIKFEGFPCIRIRSRNRFDLAQVNRWLEDRKEV